MQMARAALFLLFALVGTCEAFRVAQPASDTWARRKNWTSSSNTELHAAQSGDDSAAAAAAQAKANAEAIATAACEIVIGEDGEINQEALELCRKVADDKFRAVDMKINQFDDKIDQTHSY